MSLPHVLLGLLSAQPRTGYDLARAIREDVEPVWRAEFSQIYPALARLRREGSVVLRVLGPRRGPHRNLYRVTAAGRRELRRWLLEPPPAPRSRDDGLARVAFLDVLLPRERREVLRSYEGAVGREIARLRAAPRPDGFRKEARDAVLEKLECTRRWARALAARASGPPATDPAGRGERTIARVERTVARGERAVPGKRK
jgi:PadR family transcriptional regulator, regulatory protein AphA